MQERWDNQNVTNKATQENIKVQNTAFYWCFSEIV